MNEPSALAKVLTWLLIGTVVILTIKVVIPAIMAVFTLTVVLAMVAAPIVVIGALCYIFFKMVSRSTAY